jgi:hypothetical protein
MQPASSHVRERLAMQPDQMQPDQQPALRKQLRCAFIGRCLLQWEQN